MSLRRKIIMAIAFSVMSCLGSYLMISKIFSNLENQLYERCRIEALTGARAMSDIIKFMTDHKMLTVEDVFDRNYREIPGTNPTQYHTSYDTTFDRWIQGIEDQFLLDEDVEYAVLFDKNGYVPTHNSRFSAPQTGEYAHDLAKSRSKRIYSSYEGINSILEYKGNEVRKELYVRDTGETIWNIGAPVMVSGERWGSFIIGVNLARISAIKNQMLVIIIITMSVILVLTNLIILAMIPRRFLPEIVRERNPAPPQ